MAREEGGRLLALLADRAGSVDVAEECLQEAYARAATAWSEEIPANPAAWVYTVARNVAVDRARREAARRRRAVAHAPLIEAEAGAGADEDPRPIEELAHVGDEQLRLMLLCCHPALARDAQVALTLRLVGGLTTAEIAAAYLVPEATIAQRLVRAKRKIRDARIPLIIPADLSERAETLATVLGLVFNEGYLAHTADAGGLTRSALADQAIRLTATAADALPNEPELGGLLALQLFHRSREAARVDRNGVLVPLGRQDRTLWDRVRIAQGSMALSVALAQRRMGPWQVQALIAAEHTHDATDWERIVRLYDLLLTMTPGPVVALNRAVAVAEARGPSEGLAEVERIEGLAKYHLFHAARAHLLERLGDTTEALAAWRVAAALTTNHSEAAFAASHIDRLASRVRDDGPGASGPGF
nr:sigma-70 family RNA polymerase sigma factor [Demequina sp. TTPB684]